MKIEDPATLLRIAESLAGQLENERALALLSHLGGDCPVLFSEETETARIVRASGRLRIEVAPSFVAKWLESPRDVLFVLLHEVTHRVQGDLLRAERDPDDEHERLLANVVADVKINSFLCREVLPEGCGLLDRLYSRPTVPGLLLLPPHRLLAQRGERAVSTLRDVRLLPPGTLEGVAARAFEEARIAPQVAKALATWYCLAWLNDRCSQARLLRELRLLLRACPEAPVFLGDHTKAKGKPRLASAGGAGPGGDLHEQQIEVEVPTEPDEGLRRRVRRALERGGASPQPTSLGVERGVVPGMGRRALVTLAAGQWPVFFESRVPGAPDEDGLVRVYLDVSGSTSSEWGRVYGLVRSLGPLVAAPVFLFSTRVVPLALDEVSDGRVVTDGGTDFDCVARHVLDERFRRALVITDGEGPLDPALACALERARVGIYVLLTDRRAALHEDRGILGVAREVWVLPRHAVAGADVPF